MVVKLIFPTFPPTITTAVTPFSSLFFNQTQPINKNKESSLQWDSWLTVQRRVMFKMGQNCISRETSKGPRMDVPHVESFVRLKVGDLLVITRDSSEEQHESASNMVGSPRVTCSSGYLFDSVKPGEDYCF
ncbi:Pyruvate kinase [Artemisia annua]|uniref:Pyruvate kinase n=1 Tax=Artemisia annua TaxID=35608 RepID=A0A2U1LM36_ARTAN|nr:Pyruvate kinase [Artemisia annua]